MESIAGEKILKGQAIYLDKTDGTWKVCATIKKKFEKLKQISFRTFKKYCNPLGERECLNNITRVKTNKPVSWRYMYCDRVNCSVWKRLKP